MPEGNTPHIEGEFRIVGEDGKPQTPWTQGSPRPASQETSSGPQERVTGRIPLTPAESRRKLEELQGEVNAEPPPPLHLRTLKRVHETNKAVKKAQRTLDRGSQLAGQAEQWSEEWDRQIREQEKRNLKASGKIKLV